MECRARDLYVSFNVTLQTVDVRKARKIVMKSEIVLNTTYKTHIKHVRIFDHEKIAKLLSHSIYYSKTGSKEQMAYGSKHYMSRVMRKPTFWFSTWSDTNQAVQLQKIARGLKYRI